MEDTTPARARGGTERPLTLLVTEQDGTVLAAYEMNAYGPGGLIAQIDGWRADGQREALAGISRDPATYRVTRTTPAGPPPLTVFNPYPDERTWRPPVTGPRDGGA